MTTTADDIQSFRRAPDLRRLMLRAAMVGVAAILLAVIIAVLGNFRDFFHGYLVAYLMFLGVTLGCIGLGLLVSVVGGRWGEVVRPILTAGAKAVPLMAVLLLPLLLRLQDNYPWANAKWDADQVVVHQRRIWLTPAAFVIRAAIYFAVWAILAGAVAVWSRRRDTLSLTTAELPPDNPLRAVTGPGIAVFGVTATFAAIDWVMSVEPRWYSTIFGLTFIAGAALSALAFATLAIILFTDTGGRLLPRRGSEFGRVHVGMTGGGKPASGPLVKPTDFGDLGNLLMTFTMLWAYLNFSQFLIIWAGNMPAEVRYYTPRVMTGWRWVGLLLVICHFAVPFFTMFSRDAKRNPIVLGRVAVLVLVMRAVDWVWLIEPSVRYNMGSSEHPGPWILTDLLLLVGLGGIWLAYFCWQISGRLVLPLPIADEGHHGDAATAAAAHGPAHGAAPTIAHGGAAGAAGGHHG